MIPFDRIKSGLANFVRGVFPRIDYLGLYPATVITQNANGTLELQPDDARIPGLSGIAIRTGDPGITYTVQAGTRVLVGFANGRPDQPYAAIWEQVGAVTELDLNAGLIKLGLPAVDAMVKGTTYRTAEDTMLASISAALTAIAAAITTTANITTNGPAAGTACTAAVTAMTTFSTGASGYLSTKTKTG